MGVTKKARPISQWTVYDNEKPFRYENSSRMARHLIIGTAQQPGGTEQYIMEGFYEDLIPLVEGRRVTAHVDLYSEPAIVLEMDGKLVPHNANIEVLREDTLDIFNEEKSIVSNQIRAMTELRNNAYSQASIGKATRMLRMILSESFGTMLNYDFIRLLLREKYCAASGKDALSQEFASYTKEELISVYGGLIEKQYTKAVRIEPMKQLVEDGISPEDIDKALKDEIARRFFAGSIH